MESQAYKIAEGRFGILLRVRKAAPKKLYAICFEEFYRSSAKALANRNSLSVFQQVLNELIETY